MQPQSEWLGGSDIASSTSLGNYRKRTQSANIVRAFIYTHTQPQWTDYDEDYLNTVALAGPADFSDDFACHPQCLGRARTCLICHKTNARCDCKRCSVCECTVRMGTRHHCRACDRPVCDGCRTRRRCMRVGAAAELVCDMCAVYWGLANVSCYCGDGEAGVLRWGVYALQAVAEMPRLCMMRECRTVTYHRTCYMCHAPTIVTRHHKRRYVDLSSTSETIAEQVRMLDLTVQQARAKVIDGLTAQDVDRAFSRCFPAQQERAAFAGLRSVYESRALLLAVEAANIAYEYCGAPSITLSMSSAPYSSLLKVTASTSRYTVLQAPGKLLFVAFPGTHNLRTSLVDMKIGQSTVGVWRDVVEGVVAEQTTGQEQAAAGSCANACTSESGVRYVHGGVRKVWEYSIHNGFQREASQVDVPIPLLMNKLHAGHRVVLCGHSLGGAVAQIVTMRLLEACQRAAPPHPTRMATPATAMKPEGTATDADATAGARSFVHCTDAEHDSHDRRTKDIVQRTISGKRQSLLRSEVASESAVAASHLRHTATTTTTPAPYHSLIGPDAMLNAPGDAAESEGDADDCGDITSRVMCVAIGTPMMGDYRLAEYIEKQGWCSRFHALVYRNDIVPRLGCADQIALNALSNMYDRMIDTFMGVQSWLRWPRWGRAVSNPQSSSHNEQSSTAECTAGVTANTTAAAAAAADCSCIASLVTVEEGPDRAIMAQNMLLAGSDDMAEDMDNAPREILEKDEALVSFVDESIRHSRDTVECSSGTGTVNNNTPSNQASFAHIVSYASVAATAAGCGASSEANDTVPALSKQIVSRRYACFGRIHFLGYGPTGYRTTGHSEVGFGLLREGSGGSTSIHDHSLAAYNRGVMFHVLGTKC